MRGIREAAQTCSSDELIVWASQYQNWGSATSDRVLKLQAFILDKSRVLLIYVCCFHCETVAGYEPRRHALCDQRENPYDPGE